MYISWNLKKSYSLLLDNMAKKIICNKFKFKEINKKIIEYIIEKKIYYE